MLKKILALFAVMFALCATASAQDESVFREISPNAPKIAVDEFEVIGADTTGHSGEDTSFFIEAALLDSGKFAVLETAIAQPPRIELDYIMRGKVALKISEENSAEMTTVTATLDVQLVDAETGVVVWSKQVSKSATDDEPEDDVSEEKRKRRAIFNATYIAIHQAAYEVVENLIACIVQDTAPVVKVDEIKSVGKKSVKGELMSLIELEEALVKSGKFRVIEHVIRPNVDEKSLKPEYIFRGKFKRNILGEQSEGNLTVFITLDVQLINAKTKKIVWKNSISKEVAYDGAKGDVEEFDLIPRALYDAAYKIVENLIADIDAGKVSL